MCCSGSKPSQRAARTWIARPEERPNDVRTAQGQGLPTACACPSPRTRTNVVPQNVLLPDFSCRCATCANQTYCGRKLSQARAALGNSTSVETTGRRGWVIGAETLLPGQGRRAVSFVLATVERACCVMFLLPAACTASVCELERVDNYQCVPCLRAARLNLQPRATDRRCSAALAQRCTAQRLPSCSTHGRIACGSLLQSELQRAGMMRALWGSSCSAHACRVRCHALTDDTDTLTAPH